MTVILQFVDKIDATPTVRLDLNGGAFSLQAEGTDFGFPDLERSVVSTLLQDGGSVPASAYGLRTLTLRLLVSGTDADAVATQMQSLFRELERSRNLLKYQPHTTAPVFFRTFRSGPESVAIIRSGANQLVSVQILAESFAYGLKTTPISGTSVHAWDPTLANGLYVDVTGVKGDVETPAEIRFLASAADSRVTDATTVMSVRRRGTPSNWVHYVQAEAMTQNTDTTTQPNDGLMSGSGNNYSRCTFATVATMASRVELSTWPVDTKVDYRGTYRVFGRFRRSSATGTINVKFTDNDSVVTEATTSIQVLDLGEFTLPTGADPVTDGYSGSEFAAVGKAFQVKAERTSGTSNLDIDYIAFIPADDRMMITAWGAGVNHALDVKGVTHAINSTATAVGTSSIPSVAGGHQLLLSPNQTNRLYLMRLGVDSGSAISPDVTVSYYPRYLYTRPVSS